MIYLKKHASELGLIIAMCDEELIGKVLSAGKVYIDLDKYADFYKGELISEAEARGAMDEDKIYSANVVGERSVAVIMHKGLASKNDVKKVGKVPYLHIYNVGIF